MTAIQFNGSVVGAITNRTLHATPRSAQSGKLYFNTLEVILEQHRKAIQARRVVRVGLAAAVAPRKKASASYTRRLIQECLTAQFIVETRQGRDVFAKTLLDHMEKHGERHGLDGLLLTVMSHLKSTGSAELGRAQKVWRGTKSTAGTAQVAFNVAHEELIGLQRSAFDPARDPFSGGVELPAFEQRLAEAHGAEVMDCEQTAKVIGLVAGAIIGGAAGAEAGPWAAAEGALGGASEGAEVGGVIGGFVCGWVSRDPASTAGGGGGAPGSAENGDGGGTSVAPQSSQTSTPQSSESGGGQNDNDEEGPPPEGGGQGEGEPNPEGFPAPDDSGGGNPWSSIAVPQMLTVSQMSNVMAQTQNGGFSTQAFAPLHKGTNALNHTLTFNQNIASMFAEKGISAAVRLQLKNVTQDLVHRAALKAKVQL